MWNAEVVLWPFTTVNSYWLSHASAQKIIMRPQKHWKSVAYLTLIISTLRFCCHSYCFKMVFTADDKQLIKSLRQLIGYSSRKFLKEFPQKNWTRRGLNYLLSKIDKYGTEERVAGSGWPCTACMPDNVATVEELVQSQEDKPQTHSIVREMARETGIHQWDILSWRRFETDAASWHSWSIWKRVFRFSARQCPITSRQTQ